MKRKFGKFLSLMLVLAMLLAMVPAVLAADTTTVTMGSGDTRRFPLSTDSGVTTDSTTKWSLSNNRSSAVEIVEGFETGVYTVVRAKAATSSAVTLTAKKPGTGSNRDTTIHSWTITVKDWKVEFVEDASSDLSIVAGADKEIAAKVTGPDINNENVKVKFEVSSTNGKITVGTTTATQTDYLDVVAGGRVYTTLKTTGTDDATVTARLKHPVYVVDKNGNETYTTVNTSKTDTCSVHVTAQGDMKLAILKDKAETTGFSVKTGASSVTLSATLDGKAVTNVTWTSDNTSIVSVGRTTGKLTFGSTEGVANISVRSTDYPSVPAASCRVIVTNSTIGGVTIAKTAETEAALDVKGQKFSATYVKGYSVTTITLTALVDSTNMDIDENDVVWTTSNQSYVKFVNDEGNDVSTYTGKTATLKAVRSGQEVTITAKAGTKSDSMKVAVWTAKGYNKQEKPSLSFTASTAMNALRELEGKSVTVTLKDTGAKISLPVKNVSIDGTGDSVQIKADIDGADTKNLIIYYPQPDANDSTETAATGSISYSLSSDSDILFYEQPVSKVTYKVTDTFEPLYTYFKVTKSGYYITSVAWYDVATHNKLQGVTYSLTDAKTVLSSTFDLNENGAITGPGEYTYQCIVTAENATGNTVTGVSTGSTVTVAGDYFVEITAAKTEVSVGDTFKVSGVAQTYNPSSKKYVDVSAAHNLTWTLSDSSLATLSKTTSAKGATINVTATAGGKLVLTAKTTINGKDYEGTKTITISTPKADDVRVTLGDDDTYVMLDGSKISDAVKAATKSTPSAFMFKQPSYGTVYTSSSLSSAISTTTKYSASEVSKMAFKPTRTAGSYTIEYTAYVSNGELATGKIIVMTSSGTVTYHISANEAQAMQESDFRNIYSGTLKSVRFGSTGDSRGSLYKGSTTGSGKIDTTTSYFISSQASTGASLLSNVNFIAGSSASKYSVTIPFTASGTAGDVEGSLIVYVNDTHSIYSTGATFKSMSIADELAPESGANSAYLTITGVTGGKLYTQYTNITSCTELSSKEYNSTKFYFSGSNSVDNLYVLPKADATAVVVSYTINGSTKGSVNFKVVQQTASQKFKDVSGSTKWASNSVDFMSGNGLVNGISTKDPTVFGPNQSMTRAMLVTILYRAAGQPSVAGITNKFTDNKEKQYYYNAVLWASNNGIVNGATAKTFDPDGKITREQIAAILYRYAGSPTADTSALNSFTDRTQVSSYATTAMQWAVGNGIITGVSSNGRTTLSAKNNATRAQVAVMLHRFLTLDK